MYFKWQSSLLWRIKYVCLLSCFLLTWSTIHEYSSAEVLTLKQLTEQAIRHFYPLKISQIDVKINRTDIKSARSDYFPTIRTSVNIERLKSLQSNPTQVTTIGTTVLPTGTRFQNSISVSLNHTLIDFGVRKQKVAMAKHATEAKASEYSQILRDLKIKLVELYTDALISYKSMKANEALLTLAQKQYNLKKRLHQSGSISTVPVAEDAIQVAQSLDNIQVYKDQYSQKLQSLSYYTRENYDPQTTELEDLSEDTQDGTISVLLQHSPEARMYDALIAQKQSEISYLKRQYLPSVSWYSYYNLYGFDPNHFNQSVSSLSQRTVSLGLSMSLPVFDGFKNQAAIEKAQLEKEKLQLQKEDKLAQLQNQADLYQKQVDGYSVELNTKATILNTTQDKLTMMTRLSEQKIVDQTQAIKEHMGRIQKQVDLEKSMIQGVSALMKLKILAEG